MRLGLWLLVLVPACTFAVQGLDLPERPLGSAGGPGPLVELANASAPADLAGSGAPVDLASFPPDLLGPTSNLGDPCNGSCGGGMTCMDWLPGGYCSKTCNTSADCPGNAPCIDHKPARYCVPAYDSATCTRSGTSCRDCSTMVCAPSSFCDGC
jgi:hypothetical protein